MQALRRLRMRLFITRWTRSVVWSLIASMGLACVWLLIVKAFPLAGSVGPTVGALVATGIIVATIHAVWTRPTLLQAALEADRRLGLQERITSSLQLAAAEGPMVAAVHDDARYHLSRLNYTQEFPFTTPRAIRWLAVPAVLFLAGYVLLPEFDLFSLQERQAQAKKQELAVKAEAERLVEAIKPLEELGLEGNPELQTITAEVVRVSEQLKAGELTEKQAFAKLSNLTDRLDEQRQKLEAKSPNSKLGEQLSKLVLSREFAENLDKGNLDKTLEKAQELAEKVNSGQMSEQEKSKLAEELDKLSQSLTETNPELAEALSKFSAALKMNNAEACQDAMQNMQMTLAEMKELLQQMQKLSECRGKLAQSQNKLYCAVCQGMCKGGNCPGSGSGMRGPGRGRGNKVGDLPNVKTATDAQLAPGDVTKGKILASIVQRAAPQEGQDSTVDYSSQALVQIQQQSEEALTKEEIPAGAKEFVRQYFGSLEPERQRSPEDDPRAASPPANPQ